MAGLANGGWRNWLLGIVATLLASMVGNDILFQRDTREQLARLNEQIKRNEERAGNILKYLEQRINERTGIPFNRPDADRELHLRDLAIDRLEKRIEELEKRHR